MSTLTHDSLITWFCSRGWTATGKRHEHPAGSITTRGISIHAHSPTGYVLSIQAGFGTYSIPNHFAVEYSAVEIAVWVDIAVWDGKPSPLLEEVKLTGGDPVARVDREELIKVVQEIENMGKPPKKKKPLPRRENPPWDV